MITADEKAASVAPATSTGLLVRHPSVAMLAFAALIALLACLPPARGNDTLVATLLGAAGGLSIWTLLQRVARRGQALGIVLAAPVKAHYVQACMQLCIYAYWGWYWPQVYRQMPLIVAQLAFLYAFDGLLSWSRGRPWRIGFGPFPVVLSTNLFLWFRDDWFYLQFAMVAACALGKEFLRWKRDGKSTHIFNPSAFGLALFSVALIASGRTAEITWGVEVASTLAFPPYIYVLIFGVGLVVQYLFAVTLMTLSAVAALVLLNLSYTGITGVYQFVDTNIPAAVFLGLHLLMTDPATSPRTNIGRVIFGALYGVGAFALYTLLRQLHAPEFYDKLLTVPLLNLSVQAIDRLTRASLLVRIEAWQGHFDPRRSNLVHMATWMALFLTLVSTGFVQGAHPGASLEFWRQAANEGRPRAAENLIKLLRSAAAQGSADASNQLGLLYRDGELAPQNENLSNAFFAEASERGSLPGAANLVEQFLAVEGAQPGEVVERALARLEGAGEGAQRPRHWLLLGRAYEAGRGRAVDARRALELYQRACSGGNQEGCAAAARLGGPAAGD